MIVAPALVKATVPVTVGVPLPVTVAVNVTLVPAVDGFNPEETLVELPSLFTTSDSAELVLVR